MVDERAERASGAAVIAAPPVVGVQVRSQASLGRAIGAGARAGESAR